jgi:hypothetical protein
MGKRIAERMPTDPQYRELEVLAWKIPGKYRRFAVSPLPRFRRADHLFNLRNLARPNWEIVIVPLISHSRRLEL